MENLPLQLRNLGEDVHELKNKLQALEYRILNDNYIFDEETKIAVNSFQNDYGLKVNGMVDNDTLSALNKAYSEITGLVFDEKSDLKTTQTRPTLRLNSQNSYVIELQNSLKKLGYLTGTSDGKFGKQTEDAVKKFQRDKNLTADGVVGKGTWDAIDKALASPPTTTRPTLRKGSNNNYVFDLETALKTLGYFTGTPDQLFDTQTEDAVKRFQRDYNLTADGVVGKGTWDAIDKALASPPTTTRPTLRKGSNNNYVFDLETALKTLGYFTGTPDQLFDTQTEDAVKRFQRDKNLTADGIVGKGTWEAIDKALASPPTTTRPTLRKGSNNNYVLELETALKTLGYFTGTPDQLFDTQTEDAVKRFQRDKNLTADGIVGKGTWEAIDKALASPPTTTRPTLRKGSNNNYVFDLETALKTLGYFTGIPDQLFDTQTEDAVKRFQRDYNLTADGVVGKGTWDAIDKALASPPIDPSPENRPTLRKGSTGLYVAELELALLILGFFEGTPDGVFDSETEAAVKAFQKSKNLLADGVVGQKTWEAIENAFAAQPVVPDKPKPTLREGSRGDYVRVLQAQLKSLGLYNGEIDGVFGKTTTEAVKKFQRLNGLPADGVVGQKTWELLQEDYDSLPINLPVLREEDTGEAVQILQEKLFQLGYYIGSVTGSFGYETTQAVKAFQKASGIVADGVVGARTWKALYEQTEPNKPEEPSPIGPKPTLRFGNTGPFVGELQTELKKLMYYNGPINNSFDNKTLVAVRSFQDASKLTADGIVGRSTWYYLDSIYPPPVICG